MYRLATLLLLCSALAAQPATLAFTHVTVIDATGGPPVPNRTVLIAGDRIQSIGTRPPPRGAKIVDATGKFLIPGLWTCTSIFAAART